MSELTFNDELHEYRLGGVVVPSVTQVLGKLHDFSMVPRDVLEAACVRGTIVHRLCEYHDLNDLDPSSIGEWWPYLDAWINFIADYGAEWHGIEQRGYSRRHGFAGTMDRRGVFAKKAPGRWIVDVKTSVQPHRVWGMQTAAYRQIATEEDPSWMLARRATVQLRPDGTYRFLEWSDPEDWTAFLALIHLSNWSNKQ